MGRDVDPEIEEQLTELLENLYGRWRSCVCGVGTDEDSRDAFLQAISRRLDKGFSIITKPGLYGDEKEMEIVLGRLYNTWKNYMKGYLESRSGATIGMFIESVKNALIDLTKKDDVFWKNRIEAGELIEKSSIENEKEVSMELEKIGTKSVLGTYILESNLAYVEQEEKGKVTVVTADGISEIVSIDKLDEFVKDRCMEDDVKEELKGLISIVKRSLEN